MGEGLDAASNYNARPPEVAEIPIDDHQKQEFTKGVQYWSGALDVDEATRSADISEAATAAYMREYADHRPVNDLVQGRTRSRAGMKHERAGVTVTCKATDDLTSLLVEKREPQDGPLDKMTRTEYVLDGPDSEVVEREWFADRATGKRVDAEPEAEAEDLFTFGDEHDADITLTEEDDDDTAFTNARLWEAEDIFAQLAQEGWQHSLVEQNIRPRAPQEDQES